MCYFFSPMPFPNIAVRKHPSPASRAPPPAFQFTATHLFLIPSAWWWKLREHYGSRQWSDSEWASAGLHRSHCQPAKWVRTDRGEAKAEGRGEICSAKGWVAKTPTAPQNTTTDYSKHKKPEGVFIWYRARTYSALCIVKCNTCWGQIGFAHIS